MNILQSSHPIISRIGLEGHRIDNQYQGAARSRSLRDRRKFLGLLYIRLMSGKPDRPLLSYSRPIVVDLCFFFLYQRYLNLTTKLIMKVAMNGLGST